jgi:signal transduction histidine kinase/CheY-like chemotaxis protein
VLHPEENLNILEIITAYLEKGDSFQIMLKFLHKNGSLKWVMCRGFAVKDDSGNPIRIVGSYTDMTEIKLAEEAHIKAKEAAEESTRAKERFLANMSHEIRTPLNGILGMTALLAKTDLDKNQKNLVNITNKSGEDLLIILNDILDIAKIEAGKIELEHIPFNIKDSIVSVIRSLSYKAKEKGIHIYNLAKLIDVRVIGDPHRLNQILINLVNNAIKFTENGKIEIGVEIAKEEETSITLRFRVTDTGIGIEPEKIDNIFESFTQANSDTTRKYGGTGLGLTICRNLVEMQNGFMEITSMPGKGTTFYFSIPYTKSDDAAVKEENAIVNFKELGNIKVLLAEDNEINQFLAKEIMTGWGFSVDVASNGQEVIDLYENNEYDLILMDIQMPIMGGIEATEIIRTGKHSNTSVPIIALTANAFKDDAEKYINVGMNDYISKPFTEEALFLKIKKYCKPKPLTTMDKQLNEIPSELYVYDTTFLKKAAHFNEVLEKKLMEIYIETLPESLRNITEHSQNLDWENLSRAAHKLKTTINLLNIEPLLEDIVSLEKAQEASLSSEEINIRIKKTKSILLQVQQQFILALKA